MAPAWPKETKSLGADTHYVANVVEGRVVSRDLFKNRNYIVISHKGQDYRLTQTSTGKLILTK